MADQDFNITIRTIADTTGIKLTQQGLDAIKISALQGNQQAITALKQLSAAQKEAQGAAGAGFGGGALAIGTIIGLLGTVITKYKAFEDENDKIIQKLEKAREKSYELGLEVADMLEAMKSAERIDTEPLEFSFDRLKKKATELKTEMHLAFEAGDYESAKRYAAQLRVVESQIDQVTSAIERKRQKTEQAAAEAEKAAERERKAQESFMEGAVAGSSAQTKGVLMNEQAARKARDAGRDRDADAFQKTAEQMKASMTQAQREEYEGLTKPVRLGRQAGPGESQSIIDDIARNNINFERQKRGEQPLPQGDARGGDSQLIQVLDRVAAGLELWR